MVTEKSNQRNVVPIPAKHIRGCGHLSEQSEALTYRVNQARFFINSAFEGKRASS